MELPEIRILISGGGTGGHIFPAVAIANALKEKLPGCKILFAGANGRMEMQKVPQAGYEIQGIDISGFQRKNLFKNISLPIKIIRSLRKAKQIIKQFSPDVVVGTGGYASGPVLRVATKKGIPSLIQEQNSYPGITNKILSRRVNKICVAYSGMEKFFPKEKIILLGNPVRQDISGIENKKAEAHELFNLEPDRPVLLVVGGSLGALTVNESMERSLKLFEENNVQLIWQTGKGFFEKALGKILETESKYMKAFDFIQRMDLAYAAADVVVSRAGAIAISELCLCGKPCILVPSPNVAEDHQTKNALSLTDKNAAWLVKDIEAREILGKKAIELLGNSEEKNKLSINIKALAFPKAAENIANEVIALIKK
ncbi:MAG: undecaprenyldiphospho-muramoylpentapeptide beta-N-acetylglucosaminyltransferase [Bacteroidota bacterium]